MTTSEENYIKVIYRLSFISSKGISTSAIAEMLETKASSVTDMLKKLADKKMIHYQKYQGVNLTNKGIYTAKMIVRKHRLWEVFLVDKLHFSWDEVHEIAEELEHIKSEKLINKLDAFLEFPDIDPHGDPIPNEKGEIKKIHKKLLADVSLNISCKCVGVKDTSTEFLQYLDKQNIGLGTTFLIINREPFDNTIKVIINNNNEMLLSDKLASNLYVQ